MTDSKSHVLSIQDEMTIYTVADIKEEIISELDKEGSMKIDLAEVTEFDSAGYQLLLACKREADDRKKTLYITNPSSVVSEVLSLYKDMDIVTQS